MPVRDTSQLKTLCGQQHALRHAQSTAGRRDPLIAVPSPAGGLVLRQQDATVDVVAGKSSQQPFVGRIGNDNGFERGDALTVQLLQATVDFGGVQDLESALEYVPATACSPHLYALFAQAVDVIPDRCARDPQSMREIRARMLGAVMQQCQQL